MDTRVLDIIQNTDILQVEDLKLLSSEIEKYPYMQSLRAVYLLGTHQYENENFQKELTKTAAYTTDKRILYHLINVKKEEEQIEEIIEEPIDDISEVEPIENEEVLFVEEEGNSQIEEEVKEDDEEEEVVSGIDFYLKNIPPELLIPKKVAQPIKIVDEPVPVYTTSIMDYYCRPKKEDKVQEEIVEEKEVEVEVKEEIEEEEKVTTIDFYQKASIQEKEENKEPQNEWKPMQLDEVVPTPKPSQKEEKIEETEIVEKVEVSSIIKNEPQNIEVEEKEEVKEEINVLQSSSNVSAFINTWQNWLKIDRTPQISEQEKKAAIIDKFIENNPKISPIKDDVDFVIKEKSDDISHLMTETLAQLYLEQKLYSKAINAYKILQEKHPEKSAEFEQNIEEIKKIRHTK